jgi:hypothetical protein
MMSSWLKSGALGVVLLTGCAAGTGDLGSEDDPIKPGDAGVDAAAAEDAGADAGELDAGDPDASAADATVDAGSPCEAVTTCQAPVMLGTVVGDGGGDTLSHRGAGSAFVAVFVKEDDGSPFRIPLKVRAVLTSPAGANFDLVMYAEQDSCGAVTDASYTEFSDTVTTTWDEAFLSADDSRTVLFEIKHVSGDCAEAFPWTLEVQGNN